MKRRAERQQLYCLEQSKKLLKALGTQCEKPFLIHGEIRTGFDIRWLFPMRQVTQNNISMKIT